MNTNIAETTKENMVYNTAMKLLKPQNRITTLEIKLQLIKDFSVIHWTQAFVHDTMDYFYQQGFFIIVDDNGTYRTYSDPNYNPITVDAVVVNDVQPALTYTKSIDAASDAVTNAVKPSTVKSSIDKNKALNLMQNNRGHYFTAFIKENGTVEVLNCQFVKNKQDINAPDSVVVKLRKNAIDSYRKFNLDSLEELSINKQNFLIS